MAERRTALSRLLLGGLVALALVVPIVAAAVAAEPAAQEPLVARVVSVVPAFAQSTATDNRQATRAGPVQVAEAEPAEGGAIDLDEIEPGAEMGVPPPHLRPENWPILPEEGGADGYNDPLEGLNTVFFYVNGAMDYLLFEPLSKGYRFLMPDPLKPPIRRAFSNLSLPVVFANDLLQLEFEKAGTTLARFVINSTVGLLGLFDVAKDLGLEPHRADFGQTLHLYGVGDGFYLVLPLFGPTTARDAVGIGVDTFLDPRTYLLDTTARIGLAVGEGIVRREVLIEPVDFITEYAEDPYTAVRAWTYQKRQRELAEACKDRTLIVCPDD